jgi:hypothetical protein
LKLNPRSPALRLVVHATLGTCLLFGFMGCRTAALKGEFKTPGWEEHRLPNTSEPYDKLLVEIDAVEGTAPSADELADLKIFLEQATNKPGGITIKVDNIIPAARARGRTPKSLVLEYLNGPGDERTAFIYVLCYRSGLGRLYAKADQPNFTYYPYPCAIFIDRSFAAFKFWFCHGPMQRAFLQHEVGHALGLARNTAHSSHGHCTNKGCLMRTAINFNMRRVLTFRSPLDNTELCADCRVDLETYKSAETQANARLWHGFFLRAGEGYQILTLPGFYYVHFGELTALSLEKVAEARRGAMASATSRDDQNFNAFATLPDAAPAIARFVSREIEQDALRRVAQLIFENCIAQAEAMRETNVEQAREIASETLIGAAAPFPDLQAKLKALHEKLSVSASPVASEPPGGIETTAVKP